MSEERKIPLGQTVDCVCGKQHPILTRDMQIGDGVMEKFPESLEKLGLTGDILMIADTNTYAVAGEKLKGILEAAGRTVRVRVITRKEIHADAESIGEVMLAMEPMPKLIVSVGTGTMNDIGRICAHRTGIPYVIFGTAPSMDGFASNVTPVLIDGFKITIPGVHPEGVYAEMKILQEAPANLVAAGLGDILGKHTALLDWGLGRDLTGEHYCTEIADMTKEALDRCVDAVPGMASREYDSIEGLMKALVLSGIAMQMKGDSRPASGCEHHISHFLEMRDMLRGKKAALHGDKVGVASIIAMREYELFFEAEPHEPVFPDWNAWMDDMSRAYGSLAPILLRDNKDYLLGGEAQFRQWCAKLLPLWDEYRAKTAELPAQRALAAKALKDAGGPVLPKDLGYTKDDIYDAVRYAWVIRAKRLTLPEVATFYGDMQKIAERIVDELD